MTTTNAPATSRVTAFDVSRGIAISLMVLGHSASAVANTELGESAGWEMFNQIFGAIRMPLFFTLAGVFLVSTLKKRGYRSWVIDKAQYLLYPWLLWSLIRGFMEVGFSAVGIGADITVADVLIGIVWDPRIWYLPALFVAFAVVGGTYAALRGRRWWPAVGLVAALALIVLSSMPWWPPLLEVHPFTLFMLAGCVVGGALIAVARWPRRRAAILAIGTAVAFGVCAAFAAPAGFLDEQLSLVFVICAALGTTMLVAVGRAIDETAPGRVLEKLGTWSLIIYLTHAIPLSITRTLLMKLGVDDYTTLVLVPAVFGVALPALLGWLHDRGILRWLITMPGYRSSKKKAPARLA